MATFLVIPWLCLLVNVLAITKQNNYYFSTAAFMWLNQEAYFI